MRRNASQLGEIAAAARAILEAELEMGAEGIPRVQLPERPQESSKPVDSRQVLAVGDVSNPVSAGKGERKEKLRLLAAEAEECKACELFRGRHRSVFSRGSDEAELVFVGEGPGRDEDMQGFPFVGQAGQLLDRMITAMGYQRDDVYICNVVKCRPPENRTPLATEMIACERFLIAQLELVAPKVIVALGKCAAQALGVPTEIKGWRGAWLQWRSMPLLATYHPAFLLRSPQFKRVVWEDLQSVMIRLKKS